MWILKGTFFGLLAFATFAVLFVRNYQVRDGRISLFALRYLTIQNPWFWAAFILMICTCCVCVRMLEIPRNKGEVALGSELAVSSDAPPGLQNPHIVTLPQSFGYKTAWFAIRSDDMNAVAKAIELQQPEQVNWQYGIRHSYEYNDYQTFVTPPVRGWVLAVGMPIVWDIDSHADERLVRLSKQFGEAQLFASVRTSSAYLWARAIDGKLVRFFYYGDGEQRVIGDITGTEKELGFKFFDASSPESSQPGYWQRRDLTFPDEDHVLKIAAKWSVDPSKLDEMGLPGSLGLLGNPSSSYPPKPKPIHR